MKASPMGGMWQGWAGPIPYRQPPFGAIPKEGLPQKGSQLGLGPVRPIRSPRFLFFLSHSFFIFFSKGPCI
jgi:hypothetical protein